MKHTTWAFGLAAVLSASAAQAAVSAAEAAKLGKELTPIGAEAGANKDGSIPAWTGPANFTAEQKAYTPKILEDFRKKNPDKLEKQLEEQAGDKAVKQLFEINKSNMDQYKDKLTEGHKAMFKAYPTYKMKVFPSIRTGFFPDEVYAATIKNATAASLEGTDTVKGATLGFPFPIPKNGAEPMWNHKLKYRGPAAKRFNNQSIVRPDGSFIITKLVEDVKFKYANIAEPGDLSKNPTSILYLSEVVAPVRVAGTLTLAHELASTEAGGRRAWIYSPGLGRVNKAPDVGYDKPAEGTDNEQFTDQVDVFNGALDRYDWKLVGKKEMYIPYNSYYINSPKIKYKDILKPYHINQDLARYELHRVWVVDATLRKGTSHSFGRRTFYLDEDSWSIAAVDCYDKRGTMWKVQEAHLLTAPFIPTVTGVPEVIYDLNSKRYFTTAMVNEDAVTDFKVTFADSYFDSSNLKRKSKSK